MKCRNVCHWMTVIAGMFIGAGAGLQDYAQADTLVVNWGGNYVPPPPFHPLDFDEVANQVGPTTSMATPIHRALITAGWSISTFLIIPTMPDTTPPPRPPFFTEDTP